MAEAPKSGAEAKAEGVPKAEQEAVKSPEEARDQLLGLAEGSLEGLKGVLQILDGTSKDAAAEEMRADAGIKLEELKELFAKLLAGQKSAEGADEEGEEEKSPEAAEADKEKEVGFEVGNKISWTNKKGEVLEGEVMAVEGKTSKDGTPQVSVKVAGKKLVFLIGVDKLTKIEDKDGAEKESGPEKLIGACKDWNELMDAVKEIGDVKLGDKAETSVAYLNRLITLIQTQESLGKFVSESSDLVQFITKANGLQGKVIELLKKSEKGAAEKETPAKEGEPAEAKTSAKVESGSPAKEAPAKAEGEATEKEPGKVEKLRELVGQITTALEYIDADKPTTAKGHDLVKEALIAAGVVLEDSELTKLFDNNRAGTKEYKEALEAALGNVEGVLKSAEKEEAAEVKEKEKTDAEKAAVEKAAEKVSKLRELIDQITKALKYFDADKPTTAKGHDLVKEALIAAGALLEDSELTKLFDNNRAGTKEYKEALEAALARVEALLRDAEKELKDAEDGESDIEGELDPEALIGACQNWDELMGAINQIGDFEGSDGTVHTSEILVQAILTIKTVEEKGEFIGAGGALVQHITNTHGLRVKVIELLLVKGATELQPDPVPPGGGEGVPPGGTDGPVPPGGGEGVPPGQEGEPTSFEISKNNYAASKSKLFKGFGGLLGVPRRVFDRKGYAAAQEGVETSRAAFEAERNALVMENIDNLLTTESALADETMARMAEQKRIPGVSWAYDQWKKLGKARLIAGAALMGIGVASGLAGAGAAVVGGVYVGRKLLTLGGASTAFGTYETLTNLTGKFGAPKIKLSGERQAEAEAEKQNLQRTHGRFRFGENKRAYNEAYQTMMSGFEEEEIQAGAAEKWDDDELNKSIAYYESESPFRGQKPSENPTYMALLKQKAERLKGALASGIEEAEGAVVGARALYEQEMNAAKIEKVQEKIGDVKNYLKQWYLNEYGPVDEAEREAVADRLREQLQTMPEEVQAVLLRADADTRGDLRELLVGETVDSLNAERGQEIDADAVWAAEWNLTPALQEEFEGLLIGNEALMEEAEEGAREQMADLVASVEELEANLETTRAAVMNTITTGLNDHDKAVEKRTMTAVRRDAYRKMVAAMAAVAINTDLVRDLFTPDPEPGPGPVNPETPPEPDGGGGGEAWVPEEEGFTPWDPEISEAEVGENLDGVFGKGDGVIHVAKDLMKTNPELFEGMTDSQMQRTVLRKLMDTTLPNGEPALLWDADKGWGYNFTFHPGNELTFTTDGDGHFTGFEAEDFKIRKATNWKDFGGVKLEEVIEDSGENPVEVAANANASEGELQVYEVDKAMIDNANKMNELADEIFEAKGGIADEVHESPIIGDSDSSSMADRLEFTAEQDKYIKMQEEYLADIKSADQAIETGGELVPDAEVVVEAPISESSPIKVQTDKYTGMVDIHQEGGQTKVFVKGTVGIWDKELIDEGILKKDAFSVGHETHGGIRDFNRSAVRGLGQRVYVLDSALDDLRSTGQVERAALLEDYIDKVKTGAVKEYGDIFQ